MPINPLPENIYDLGFDKNLVRNPVTDSTLVYNSVDGLTQAPVVQFGSISNSNPASSFPTGTSSGYLANLAGGFGGSGTDGDLIISSGTTTIDLASAAMVTKNYRSISITGTAALAFSNANANGSIVVLKSQGNVTINSSTVPVIDLRSFGAPGGASPGSNSNGNPGSDGNGNITAPIGGSRGLVGSGAAGGAGGLGSLLTSLSGLKSVKLVAGSGGGSGGSSTVGGLGGAGGRGGGALYIECRGTYLCSSTINVAGAVGSAGTNGSGAGAAASGGGGGGSSKAGTAGASADVGGAFTDAGGGGGGGGGGGTIIILYNVLNSDTGTYTVSGGAGGSAGNAGGAGGAGSSGYSIRELNTNFV